MTTSHRILTRLFVEIGEDRRSTATCSYLLHDRFSRCLNRRKGQVLRLVMTRQLTVRWIRLLCRTSRHVCQRWSARVLASAHATCAVFCLVVRASARATGAAVVIPEATHWSSSFLSSSGCCCAFFRHLGAVCCRMLCVASNLSVQCVLWC